MISCKCICGYNNLWQLNEPMVCLGCGRTAYPPILPPPEPLMDGCLCDCGHYNKFDPSNNPPTCKKCGDPLVMTLPIPPSRTPVMDTITKAYNKGFVAGFIPGLWIGAAWAAIVSVILFFVVYAK